MSVETTDIVLSGTNAMALPETWFRGQIDTLKELIAKDCSDPELDLFAKICKMRGLNPFSRQIYAVKMQGKMSIQVGIDGLRLIALRSGEYEGQTPVQWCGKDNAWVDAWFSEEPPAAARVGVYRKGFREALWGVATFESYKSTYKKGNETKLTPMWVRMPDVMLAKCAEALALRKAFPQETEGLYTPEEMDQASNPTPDPRPVHDPDMGGLPRAEQDSLRKMVWSLADQLLGSDGKEAKLYKFGTAARLIYLNADGKPSLKVTPKSKILELIDRMQTALDKRPAQEVEEIQDAEIVEPEEKPPTVKDVTLTMQIEVLESALSGSPKIEGRAAFYSSQFEDCLDMVAERFGEDATKTFLPGWNGKTPDFVGATDEQLTNWLDWLRALEANS